MGRRYSNRQRWKPGLAAPYVVGSCERDDQPGLRLLSNVVELAPDQVRIGMPVHVTFEQHEDVWLPLFKKAE